MDSYVTTQYTKEREPVKRRRWVCKPCTATKKRISRLKRLGRLDELDRAIEQGEHSRAARIQANSRQNRSQAQNT